MAEAELRALELEVGRMVWQPLRRDLEVYTCLVYAILEDPADLGWRGRSHMECILDSQLYYESNEEMSSIFAVVARRFAFENLEDGRDLTASKMRSK